MSIGVGPLVLIPAPCVLKTMNFYRSPLQEEDAIPLILAQSVLLAGARNHQMIMAQRENPEVGTICVFPGERGELPWKYPNYASIVFTWKGLQRKNTEG